MTGTVLALAVALSAAAPHAAPARGDVTLGVLRPVSGADAAAARDQADGAALAIDDLRREGVPVQARLVDDGGDPRAAVDAVERLAGDQRVAGIVAASTSEVADAAGRAAQRFEIPVVVASAARDEITRLRFAWLFRVGATTGQDAAALVQMARAAGAPRTIAILGEDTAFGDAEVRSAHAFAMGNRMKVVYEDRWPADAVSWVPALRRARAARPDVVFLAAERADARRLLADAHAAGLAPRAFLAAGPAFAAPTFLAADALSRGVFRAEQWRPEEGGDAGRAFAARFAARYGRAPGAGAAIAYAATVILGREAARAGGDRARLRAALEAGRWAAVTGPVAFRDEEGFTHQNAQPVFVEQILDGRGVPVWPRALAAAAPRWPAWTGQRAR